MAELAKQEVLAWLPKLTEQNLVEICGGLLPVVLTVKEGKLGKNQSMRNIIRRYLCSEDVEELEDEGLSIFEKLKGDMESMMLEDMENDTKKKLEELKKTIDANLGDSSRSEIGFGDLQRLNDIDPATIQKFREGTQGLNARGSKVLGPQDPPLSGPPLPFGGPPSDPLALPPQQRSGYSIHKLREFKIVGGTVGGEKGLDFSSLNYQMKEGLRNYTEKEVMSGVIKAIQVGCSLKRYLEGQGRLSFKEFRGVLMSHYNVKDSTTLLDEMVNSVQEPKQTLMNYVLKMLALRDEILEVTKDEDCPLGEVWVKRRFKDSLLSGVRKPTIRLEMQALLKEGKADPELLKEVNLLMVKEEENAKKLGKSVVKGDASALDVVGDPPAGWKEERKKDKEQQQKMENTLAVLTAQVQELTTHLKQIQDKSNGRQANEGATDRGGKRFVKCDDCERERKFCTHCRKCKEEGHKAYQCTKNV